MGQATGCVGVAEITVKGAVARHWVAQNGGHRRRDGPSAQELRTPSPVLRRRYTWNATLAPAATPPAIVDKYAGAIKIVRPSGEPIRGRSSAG